MHRPKYSNHSFVQESNHKTHLRDLGATRTVHPIILYFLLGTVQLTTRSHLLPSAYFYNGCAVCHRTMYVCCNKCSDMGNQDSCTLPHRAGAGLYVENNASYVRGKAAWAANPRQQTADH